MEERRKQFIEECAKFGIIVLNPNDYWNQKSEMDFICSLGHKFTDRPERLLRRVHKCPLCNEEERIIARDIDFSDQIRDPKFEERALMRIFNEVFGSYHVEEKIKEKAIKLAKWMQKFVLNKGKFVKPQAFAALSLYALDKKAKKIQISELCGVSFMTVHNLSMFIFNEPPGVIKEKFRDII